MKAQVVASGYVQIVNGARRMHRRGATIDVSSAEFDAGVEAGVLRKPSDSELPEPNFIAADPAPTQPDGTPLREDADGNPLEAGATPEAEAETVSYRTHKDADARASDLGISFPDGTTVEAKNEAINAYLAAQASGEAATTEDISELSDDELRERAKVYGLSDDEVSELEHDALVLAVAEAMNRQTADPAEQAQRNAAGSEE